MNIIKVCNKCKATNLKTLLPKLEKISDVKIIIGCHNLCGIGRMKNFCILNNIPIIADNENELIEKINAKLKEK